MECVDVLGYNVVSPSTRNGIGQMVLLVGYSWCRGLSLLDSIMSALGRASGLR